MSGEQDLDRQLRDAIKSRRLTTTSGPEAGAGNDFDRAIRGLRRGRPEDFASVDDWIRARGRLPRETTEEGK